MAARRRGTVRGVVHHAGVPLGQSGNLGLLLLLLLILLVLELVILLSNLMMLPLLH